MLQRLQLSLRLLWTIAPLRVAAAPAPNWISLASVPGVRALALPVDAAATNRSGFSLLPPSASGIVFTNLLPESRHLTNSILLNGAGVAAGDVDGDGWTDLFFCGLHGRCALYRNLGGFRFEDITEAAGVALEGVTATGCALVDLDGDGDLDLVVNSLGQGTQILWNDGHGHFSRTLPIFNAGGGAMSLGVGDLDGDGYLDLYIANYRTSAFMDIPNKRATFKRVNGRTELDTLNGRSTQEEDLRDRFSVGPRGSLDELGQPDLVLRNVGGTNFVPLSFTAGAFLDEAGQPLVQPPRDWGLSVLVRDLNQDGLPDIYVCNDFQTEDRFWINQGNGRFRLAPKRSVRHTSMFSMGADAADVNHDGFDDLLVVDMLSRSHARRMQDLRDVPPVVPPIGDLDTRPQYPRNALFLNRGDGTFAEAAHYAGLEAAEWAWACVFLDVDLDGWEDLLISSGMERAARDLDTADQLKALRAARRLSDAEVLEARRKFPRLPTGTMAFRNRGDLHFEDAGAAWQFQQPGIAQGMALADLDNDGDLDVVVTSLNAPPRIYRNDASASRVAVRLRGRAPNTRGLGARITVRGGAVSEQSQEMMAGGRYLSSDDSVRTFAAGGADHRLEIEVRWRSGTRSVISGLLPGQLYEIDEALTAKPAVVPPAPKREATLFEDVSAMLDHVHHETPFEDTALQPLLSERLSQSGPGVLWFDLDGDGREELVVGSGSGGSPAVFHNEGGGRFKRSSLAGLEAPLMRDQTAWAAFHEGGPKPQTVLLSALSNYEDGGRDGAAVRQYNFPEGVATDPIPATESAAGSIALADVNGDGVPDLFVGGRVIPGKYPTAASSRLFHRVGGKWVPDAESLKTFRDVGMVQGAVFTDLDGDGRPDLALACDWGAVRVFMNRAGHLVDATQSLGLASSTGRWNGIAAADVDGDGRMDLIVSNSGRNTPGESSFRSGHPLRLYFGDLDGDGTVELIESEFDGEAGKYLPVRLLSSLVKTMPFLAERYPSNRAFSRASVDEMLVGRNPGMQFVEASILDSSVFLNRGDHFERRSLPAQAQMAPASGVVAGDFDGDGRVDVFLSQNQFDVIPELPRSDAGLGLLCLGDGTGGFRALRPVESGIYAWGEQRGAAAADFDGDGRLDLAVGQNGAATLLFQNRTARPGLRVRLLGPASNPDAIGASARWSVNGIPQGPRQELHAGSGRGSQDSLVMLFVPPTGVSPVLEVRWPGGALTRTPISVTTGLVQIRTDGSL